MTRNKVRDMTLGGILFSLRKREGRRARSHVRITKQNVSHLGSEHNFRELEFLWNRWLAVYMYTSYKDLMFLI